MISGMAHKGWCVVVQFVRSPTRVLNASVSWRERPSIASSDSSCAISGCGKECWRARMKLSMPESNLETEWVLAMDWRRVAKDSLGACVNCDVEISEMCDKRYARSLLSLWVIAQ